MPGSLTGARLPAGPPGEQPEPPLTWCVQRLVGSPAWPRSRRWSTSRTGSCARREAITLSVETDSSPESIDSTENETPEIEDAEIENPEDESGDLLEEAHPLQAGAPVQDDSPTFAELGVRPEIVAALAEAGIERTFAIQELTLPLALAGEDVIGQARTGMGKTLGFGVPLLQRVTPPSEQPAANVEGEAADRTKDVPQALVVVPTRELCVQRHLVLGRVQALVLDEADEMLDLGFLPDVERIMRMLPEKRHTMLFSATMPGPIIALSRAFLNRPTHIRAEEADQGSIHERTTQLVYRAHAMDKVELLTRVLQAKDRGLTMIFARTKRTVQRVADDLADRGFAAAAVHGDLGQGAREQALRAFRSGKVDVLVATDVAARGLDAEYVDTEGDQGGRRRKPRERNGAAPVEEPRPARQRRARTRSRGGELLE